MLNLINPSHDILEDLLKQELAVINDDLGGKINKLEENITDLKTLMNTTMESLKGLNKVNSSKRKNFSIPGGIFFFESLQARLKQHLAAIALSYDPVLYTALDGCYEIYTANKDRFPLLDKVIAFINNTDKKTLLILAESGFGKTSFSVYLTRYLLNDSFTLSRNYRVLPFYLSLSRITTKNTETTTLESVLQHYYRFTQEEVDLLFENNQLNFCFIFDDVNESNLNMDFIRKICSRFSFSHYIFMAALSEFKSKQACERLLRSSYPGKGVSEEKTIYLAPFNKRAKKIIFLITWQALKKNYIQLILR